MSNHSVIEHKASYHFIKLEEDYLAICSNSKGKASPHCKAFILSIIEHWMNTKRARGEGNYAYITTPQWIMHMYMLYERNVIESCIKELLEEGLIERRAFKLHGQNTFEYTLNVGAIQERIRNLPAKQPNEALPNLSNYLAHKAKCKAEKEQVREKSPTSKTKASEKSPTSKVREKSPTSSEKSPTLSTGRYVKNHDNIDSITEIPTTSDIASVVSPDFGLSTTIEQLSTGNTPFPVAKPTTKNSEPLTIGNTNISMLEGIRKTIGDYAEAELRKLSQQELASLLTSKQTEILARWRSIFKAPVKLDAKIARALYDLEPYDPSAETLDSIRLYCYTIDLPSEKFPKGYYKTRGVKLWDVVEHFADWQQIQDLTVAERTPKPKKRKMTDEERNALPL